MILAIDNMGISGASTGLNVTITQAREQLRLFIIKNELERVAANQLRVLNIRATAKTTGRINDENESERQRLF